MKFTVKKEELIEVIPRESKIEMHPLELPDVIILEGEPVEECTGKFSSAFDCPTHDPRKSKPQPMEKKGYVCYPVEDGIPMQDVPKNEEGN